MKEIRVFFTALMFYSRLPCPAWVDHSEEYLNLATRYFPLIGWIVAAISGSVFWAASLVLPTGPAIVLGMIASVLTTGAFHEDGFADVCDGFGGGWTKEKILTIMKDSRVGAYGAIGIGLLLGLKFVALQALLGLGLLPAAGLYLAAHSVSRLAAVGIIATATYAREDADAKAKPIAKALSAPTFIIAVVLGLAPLAMLACYFPLLALVLLPVGAMVVYLRGYFLKWLQGYTGDCLGTTQQVTEVIVYLSALALWRFIS